MNNSRSGEILNQKYKIVEVIGEGGTGITYKAIALDTEQPVAIKNLSLRGLDNWKQVELFEREAKMLATLNHPAIPKYLDYFCVDSDRSKDFYIVQQLAPGKPLFELVKDGWRTTEAEIKAIAEQILDILVYLHGLVPAVIHRDIKPQNLIRSDDGKIFLVDFGAVQNTYYTNLKQGSTVVGTYGFMAPEQFRGQAVVATDLYNLGATIVYLLTHCPPAELPHKNLKIDFRDRVRVSHQFATWLDKLIEPNIEHRFDSAASALVELRSHTFTTRESFKKLFQTQFNLLAVALMATMSIASISLVKLSGTEESKIVGIEKNPVQLCSDLKLTQYYLNNGGNPNIIINFNNTESNLLFCLLANTKNYDVHKSEFLNTIELLIDAGADLEAINNQSQTPLLFWLSPHNRRYSSRSKNIVREVANLLIEKGADINARDSRNNTPLLLSMSKHVRDSNLTKKLIDLGANINAHNHQDTTILSIAIENNNVEFINFLINKGADYNFIDTNGETLLFKAVEKSRRHSVKYLIEKGIDINALNNNNQTAIIKLFRNRNHGEKEAIAKLLIAGGAKVDIKDKYNRSLLSYMAGDSNLSPSIVESLLNQGIEINNVDSQGYTALSYAMNTKNWQVAEILIKRGANVETKTNQDGLTPIFKAVDENILELTKLLIEKNANLNIVDSAGNNLLIKTFHRRNELNLEILKLLLERGLDINAQNSKGNTLLSLFVDNNYYYKNHQYRQKTIKYLIKNGADVNLKDKKGRSPLLKATYHNDREIINLLKKHGAKY